MFNNQVHFTVKSATDYYEDFVAMTAVFSTHKVRLPTIVTWNPQGGSTLERSYMLSDGLCTSRRVDSMRKYLTPLSIYQISHLLTFWTNKIRK